MRKGGNPSQMKLQWGHRLSAMETILPHKAESEILIASMGPPPFGDGNRRPPGCRGPHCPQLQWGHRLSAMETALSQRRRDARPAASMGPPPFGDGNFLLPQYRSLGQPAASMGPPPFGDGNLLRSARYILPTVRFNGATAFRRWKRSPDREMPARDHRFNGATAFRRWKPCNLAQGRAEWLALQWGHRLSAMETAASGTRRWA